ncbi:chorismate mutase [Marinosulfonomonas sp. PRT-SC04]|nr:chorismate mutase [Marinosulfonomonas sp. PRT-SC04]
MRSVTEFQNMTDLRGEIDMLDGQIVALLARRAALIDRAVVLKPVEGLPARIDARVDAVLQNVRAHADAAGLDAALVEMIWRGMIEWSISREEVTLGKSLN